MATVWPVTVSTDLGDNPSFITTALATPIQFAGYYAAIHKGFYAQEGLEVTLKQGGVGIEPVTEVLSGRAQFGVSNAGLIADYLNGRSVLMLAPIFQHSPNVLLVRGDVATPAELVDAGPIALMGGDQDIDLKADVRQ